MKKFQGVEQKSLEFQGVHQKLRKIVDFKRGFPWGSMQKKRKIPGGHGKFNWKSRRWTSRKSISSTDGGYNCFWKIPFKDIFETSSRHSRRKRDVLRDVSSRHVILQKTFRRRYWDILKMFSVIPRPSNDIFA